MSIPSQPRLSINSALTLAANACGSGMSFQPTGGCGVPISEAITLMPACCSVWMPAAVYCQPWLWLIPKQRLIPLFGYRL